MKYKSLFLLGVFAFTCQLFSQGGTMGVWVRKFTQDEGLSSYYVTKILRDSKGFFWIGTQEGLSRFDGKNFTNYISQSEPRHQIGGSNVSDIIEDQKRSTIWMCTAYGEVCGIDVLTGIVKKRISYDQKGKSLSDKWLRCLCIQDDVLWIGFAGGAIAYDLKNNTYLAENKTAGLANANISKMAIDSQGRVWAFCDDEGVKLIDKNRRVLNLFPAKRLAGTKKPGQKLLFNQIDVDGRYLYAATSCGLKIFDMSDGGYLKTTANNFLDTAVMVNVTAYNDSRILFSTNNQFYCYNPKTNSIEKFQDENQKENNWFEFVYQSYYDKYENKVWIGTQEGVGYFSERDIPFKKFYASNDQRTKLKHLYSLLPGMRSIVYCGDENGFFAVDTKTNSIKKIDDAMTNLMIFTTNKGVTLVSNQKGLQVLDKEKLIPAVTRFPCLLPVQHDRVSCGLQFNDSLVMFSSFIQNGLSIWDTKNNKLSIYHKNSRQNPIENLDIINSLYKTQNAELLILTEKSIIDFNPVSGKYTSHQIQKGTLAPFSNFMDMSETTESYWLATYGNGVIETDKRFRVKNVYTTKNGLSNDCVYKAFSIGDSLLLLTTNKGVSCMDLKTRRIKTYLQSDGLNSSAFEQFCGTYQKGLIYAGGVNGFSVINPALIVTNKTPPTLYINRFHIETSTSVIDTSNLLMKELEVPNNYSRISIYLSALNYSNPSRINYAFRIDNEKWINQKDQDFIDLIGMGPGKYRLEVKASNEEDVWSDPVSLNLVILPKWYQTWWFKLLVVLAIAALLYALYRYRVQQILKLERVRQKISSDLHDDIGSTLSSVNLFTKMAIMQPGKKEYLPYIDQGIQNAIIGVRDIIWILDKHPETIESIFGRIVSFSGPLCEAAGSELETRINDDLKQYQLTAEEKRNTYLVIKEAINNSLKYSGCTRIQLTATGNAGQVSISVNDNGKGLAKDEAGTTKIAATGSGNGLKNMQLRCDEIKWKLEIKSAADAGTAVTMIGKLRT